MLIQTYYFKDPKIEVSQINDCGVMIFDSMQNREIDFIANQTPFIKHLETKYKENAFMKGSNEEHIYIRKEMVNNSKYNFGVLNGDKRALDLIHYGATNLFSNQLILFYSDGFIPFVYNDEFINILFTKNEDHSKQYILNKEQETDKFKKEKTLMNKLRYIMDECTLG